MNISTTIIKPNKTLDLNPFFFKGGDLGCLLIHGGTGSPPEMRGMGEYLAEQGLTVLGVRLAGHGTTPEDLATKTWRDLIASAEHGLKQIQAECDRVFVGGLSVGGLLTLHLAANYPIRGGVVMSAPAYMKDWRLRLLPVVKLFIKWHHVTGEPDLIDPDAEQRLSFYRRVPVVFGQEFLRLLDAVRQELHQVETPLLFMQGDCDHTIPPESSQYFFEHVGSLDKEIVMFPNSGHAITVDSERESVWARAYEFIVQHSS